MRYLCQPLLPNIFLSVFFPAKELTGLQARVLLESLISANHSFASLTFNLSTIYELCSDKSTGLKSQLSDAVARQPVSGDMNLDRPNADFKL